MLDETRQGNHDTVHLRFPSLETCLCRPGRFPYSFYDVRVRRIIEIISVGVEVIAVGVEAIAVGVEAVSVRVEVNAIGVKAIAVCVEAIAV